jgi:hypothetical protein
MPSWPPGPTRTTVLNGRNGSFQTIPTIARGGGGGQLRIILPPITIYGNLPKPGGPIKPPKPIWQPPTPGTGRTGPWDRGDRNRQEAERQRRQAEERARAEQERRRREREAEERKRREEAERKRREEAERRKAVTEKQQADLRRRLDEQDRRRRADLQRQADDRRRQQQERDRQAQRQRDLQARRGTQATFWSRLAGGMFGGLFVGTAHAEGVRKGDLIENRKGAVTTVDNVLPAGEKIFVQQQEAEAQGNLKNHQKIVDRLDAEASRGGVPLELLLGWIDKESSGRLGYVEPKGDLDEIGLFQISADERTDYLKLKPADRAKILTDATFSIRQGVRLANFYQQVLEKKFDIATGSPAVWELVKLCHKSGLPTVDRMLTNLQKANVDLSQASWRDLKQAVSQQPRSGRMLQHMGRVDAVMIRGNYLRAQLVGRDL